MLFFVPSVSALETWTEDDFTAHTGDKWGVVLTFEVVGTDAVWTVTMDEGDISGHWHTGVQLVICGEFLLGWSSEDTTQPIYKEVTGGSWGAPQPLPPEMSVSGNYNEVHYVIKVPLSKLPRHPCPWAFNVEASWPGHSSAEQMHTPTGWIRWSTDRCDTYRQTELPDPPPPLPVGGTIHNVNIFALLLPYIMGIAILVIIAIIKKIGL